MKTESLEEWFDKLASQIPVKTNIKVQEKQKVESDITLTQEELDEFLLPKIKKSQLDILNSEIL